MVCRRWLRRMRNCLGKISGSLAIVKSGVDIDFVVMVCMQNQHQHQGSLLSLSLSVSVSIPYQLTNPKKNSLLDPISIPNPLTRSREMESSHPQLADRYPACSSSALSGLTTNLDYRCAHPSPKLS